MKRIVCWTMLALILVGTLASAFNVGLARGQAETVYLNSDRSVPSSSAPLSSILANRDELALAGGNSSNAGNSSAEFVIGINGTGQTSEEEIEDYLQQSGGSLVDSISMGSEFQAVVANVSFSSELPFLSKVETAGFASFVEPNVEFKADWVPNDPDWHSQWGLQKIEADYAWNTTVGSRSILVAVVDTGIDWSHPDLAANYVPLGYNWVENNPDPMDDYGHGTHVAGIIAAALNNSIGVAGIAQVRIMAEKVLDETGSGTSDNVAKGIIDAVNKGAKIINLSLGSPYDSEIVHEAILYAYERGVLIVAAAGNDASDVKSYPAAYPEVVAVTATNENDQPAVYTNFGDWVDIAAPGNDIYSAMLKDSYSFLSGTSMASPMVAGVAALIWSEFPNMTRDQVWAQLEYSTDPIVKPETYLAPPEYSGQPSFPYSPPPCLFYGFGRINAAKAVEDVPGEHEVLVMKLNIPSCLRPQTVEVINGTILDMGAGSENNVTVQLLINDSAVASVMIPSLTSGESTQISFSWMTGSEGIYNVTLLVQPPMGETFVGNTTLYRNVEVRSPQVLSVPSQYSTIAEAVYEARDGDTVFIAPGTYNENVLIWQQDLNIVGENENDTIINGGGSGSGEAVIFAYESQVAISGLTLRGGGAILAPFAGLFAEGSDGMTISNVTALDDFYGIALLAADNAILKGVNMTQNTYNFMVDGGTLADFMLDADTSNTVNGKPIYYLVNQHDEQVPSDAGYVAVVNSTGITVNDVALNQNNDGVLFAYTNDSCVQRVNASSNWIGIYLLESYDNNISGNSVENNELGIYLYDSAGNFLRDNSMSNNYYNFAIDGDSVSSFAENIDNSNTVNANPIYYLMNQNDVQVPANAGYVAAVNSDNITVANMNVSNNFEEILFVNSNSSQIVNVTISNCNDAIYMWHSNNDLVSNNNISSCDFGGIVLDSSDGNSIKNNILSRTMTVGICCQETSNDNIIESNTVTDSTVAIDSTRSYSNIIDGNTASEYGRGIQLWYSDNCTVFGNNLLGTGSLWGIDLVGAQANLIEDNLIANSTQSIGGLALGAGIFLEDLSDNNTIIENTLIQNSLGVMIGDPFAVILVDSDDNNSIYHNNFIQNSIMQVSTVNSVNSWDDGYPSGGNYWSDYAGQDLKSGPYQNLTGSDSIGDTPYIINWNNIDHYPLMNPHPRHVQVTFDQAGVGSDFTGTVIIIDGVGYKASDLPQTFTWSVNSTHIFSYQSPLTVSSSVKPYFWDSTIGFSTLQTGSINITGPGSITADYVSNVHDVIVTGVATSKSWVYQGQPTHVNVTVSNIGDFPEIVWVTLYCNITADKSINAYPVHLDMGQSYTLPFTWNTADTPCLNYTLTAVATVPTGSKTLSNEIISVRLMGDVNGDGRVDMKDIAIVARAFGSTPTSSNWNPAVDINGDGTIDMKDIAIVARNFGQHYP